MVYDWVQGRTFHYLALKNLDLESNFNTKMFPVFSLAAECNIEGRGECVALYRFGKHTVVFSDKWFYQNKWFAQVYFHELMHSTAQYNNRYHGMWTKLGLSFVNDIVGLEETLVEIASLVLCSRFEKTMNATRITKLIKAVVAENPTNLALPWGEVEEAVLCYLKDKDCPKIKMTLLLFRTVIEDGNLMQIYEGKFNEQAHDDSVAV